MAKMTLLELVQNILSAIDSDDVNSISDTVEAMQVAEVVKETYYDVFGNLDIPEFKTLATLTSSGNSALPCVMSIPDTLRKIDWIKYDYLTAGSGDYRLITYMKPELFLDYQHNLLGADSTQQMVIEGTSITIRNDKNPIYWTSFDDEDLVFDSFDSSVDTTLQQTKTQVWGTLDPPWTVSDSFIPRIDSNLFPLLLSEAKATCFINLKQVSSAKEEQKARRNMVRMQNDRFKANQDKPSINRLPNYGRPSR